MLSRRRLLNNGRLQVGEPTLARTETAPLELTAAYRPDADHDAYCCAMQAANRRLLAWLRHRPDPDVVAEALAAFASVQQQLYRLWLAGAVR